MNGLGLFFVGHRISDSVFCWSEMDGGRLSSANFGGRGLSIGPPIVSLHRAKMSPTNDKMHADREAWVALVAPGRLFGIGKNYHSGTAGDTMERLCKCTLYCTMYTIHVKTSLLVSNIRLLFGFVKLNQSTNSETTCSMYKIY